MKFEVFNSQAKSLTNPENRKEAIEECNEIMEEMKWTIQDTLEGSGVTFEIVAEMHSDGLEHFYVVLPDDTDIKHIFNIGFSIGWGTRHGSFG